MTYLPLLMKKEGKNKMVLRDEDIISQDIVSKHGGLDIDCFISSEKCKIKRDFEKLKKNNKELNDKLMLEIKVKENIEKKLEGSQDETTKKEILKEVKESNLVSRITAVSEKWEEKFKEEEEKSKFLKKQNEQLNQELSSIMTEEQTNDYLRDLHKQVKVKERHRKNLDKAIRDLRAEEELVKARILKEQFVFKKLADRNNNLLRMIKAKVDVVVEKELLPKKKSWFFGIIEKK